MSTRAVLLPAWMLIAAATARADGPIRVGAKNFTEQHILGEMIAGLIERHTDLPVERVFDLGGTGLCHSALASGSLDVYVEYTGTALLDILHLERLSDSQTAYRVVAREYRERFDIEWLPPIGFNNTYRIAVRRREASERGWNSIDDLPTGTLRAGFTSEFIERPDGYPGLADVYGLRFRDVRDVDPGLMYQALAGGQVDVICAFATDGRIAEYGLHTLEDTRGFFPPYDAAPVISGAVLRRHPEIREALISLVRTIDDRAMRALNVQVDRDGRRPADVAAAWLAGLPMSAGENTSGLARSRDSSKKHAWATVLSRRAELTRKILEHLVLTGLAVMIAVAAGVPLGVVIYRRRVLASGVLAMAEIVQTIPSLAMLAFLFALYQTLGTAPAVTALVLYALLPIVLNTYTGLRSLPAETIEAAEGIGMSGAQRLRLVELPLALPVIVAGVRTATVWTVGIATLSTYIGAGGLGDFISRGLARNDAKLTLLGAVPAALMAVALSALIRLVERRLRR